MSDRDEAGVYRIPGTPTLRVSTPPALEFRLPAEFHRSRRSRSHLAMSVVMIVMSGIVIWSWMPWSRHTSAPSDAASILAFIPFMVLIFALPCFLVLQVVNRIVADHYVGFFEDGARLTVDKDHISDNRVSRAPIAWRDVASAFIEAGKAGTFVSLKLRPGVRVRFRGFRPDHWIFNRVLRQFGGKTVEIATSGFGVDEVALAQLIKAVADNERDDDGASASAA